MPERPNRYLCSNIRTVGPVLFVSLPASVHACFGYQIRDIYIVGRIGRDPTSMKKKAIGGEGETQRTQ